MESALLRVQNDVLLSLDKGQSVFLVLLDLSAAFNTIDHGKLLSTLHDHIGVADNALRWFASYFRDRSQRTVINGSSSNLSGLTCGVPQGSVLGPLLFTVYTLALVDTIMAHDLEYHMYADDTQLYLSFDGSLAASCIRNMESCIADIQSCMTRNFLKLNNNKTEFMVFSSRFRKSSPANCSIHVGDICVPQIHSVKDLEAFLDTHMTLETHVNNIARAGFMHLRRISHIRQHLDRTSSETLVHAFVSSKIDGLNLMLCGLPDFRVGKLQRLDLLWAV